MVKIFDEDETPRPGDEDALIELVLKRMPLGCFDDRETVRYLVRQSGGHVRDLLRLVRTAFARVTGERITRDVAEQAARDMASEYQRLVRQNDWPDLVRIELSMGEEKDRTDDRLRLLHDLVLLESNNFWWRSHPLVRLLKPYGKARAAAIAG